MTSLIQLASRSFKGRLRHAQNDLSLERINRQVAEHARSDPGRAPVVFFNASTRLTGLSLNAAYNLIASWAVRLSGTPVIHFACQGGLSRCVLGTNRKDLLELPPCTTCIAQSRTIHAHSQTHWFISKPDEELEHVLNGQNLADLMSFEWKSVPLGSLTLASMRWVLRRHHLLDDDATRFLYREFIQSAQRVQEEFSGLIQAERPQAVVVFNGMFYPEAAARWTAWKKGLRVISHEVGLRPYTAFFTPGDATAYPIHIPASFELNKAQNDLLDEYLSQRMQGNFSMAGVRFWPEMRRLDDAFLSRAAQFKQIVPIFTNVIFDTSQPHSNVVFPHMFAWLENAAEIAKRHPDTLFVIRAHPDEARQGKESCESVSDWVVKSRVCDLPNVLFFDPRQYVSSYELIQRAKFVMVYNSTIGLEASLMGAPVLCAGKARFTQLSTVFFPASVEEYWAQAESFLDVDRIEVPAEFSRNARRFLYFQLYRTSLPFDAFIEEDGIWRGYVRLKSKAYTAFDPQNNEVLRVVVDGILNGSEFLLDV